MCKARLQNLINIYFIKLGFVSPFPSMLSFGRVLFISVDVFSLFDWL